MSGRGRNEGFRVLDDFVCEAVHNPLVPRAPRDKRGRNVGANVLPEMAVNVGGVEAMADQARVELLVEITTQEPALVGELLAEFGSPVYGARGRNHLGIEIEWETLTGPKAFEGADIVVFVVSNVTAVGSGVLANWLYDRLKTRATRLRLGGQPVAVSSTDIEAAVIKAATPPPGERPNGQP
jgi:hypothetical protein